MSIDNQYKSVHVRLAADDHEKLSNMANEFGCSRATVVRILVREYSKLKLQITAEEVRDE